MKRLQILLLSLVLLIGTASVANVTQQQSLYNQEDLIQNVFEQMNEVNNQVENKMTDKSQILSDRYMNNFRECEPLHINQYLDFFGLKFGFKLDINGWVNGKCEYNISAKLEGLGKDIREVYNVKVSDSKLSEIEPIVKCGFTKEQLNAVVDYVVTEEQNLSSGNKVKQNSKGGLTPEQKNLVSMFVNDNACTVLNMETLQSQIIEIMQSSDL